ncbi:cytosine permease [Agrococcus sp. HG114]|uniref:purine-cytosine permease family protein n=1 Tax=Agrococcus sp. HG114 TaxID=2969757 RepID=UPI00215B265B|nr:cytosine permease [Agrococcus sp. HG114]MCR8669543.1 cytosine permease [Agrococcus sp. HG114]
MTEIDPGATSVPTYGTSLTRTEPFATEEIPVAERHGHPRHQFTLWFAANMVLAVLVSGFFSSLFGLTVWQGLSAVAVGTLLGAVVMGVLAGIGTKLGVPQQVQGRGPMGFLGNFLPIALLTVVSAIGWTAVNTVFAVLALQQLVEVPFWAAAVAIFAVQAVFAIWGHNLIHLVNKIATVVLAILFAVITVLSLQRTEFTQVVNTDAPYFVGEFAGWLTFAGFFFAYVMTWTPFASDFSRYLPRTTSHAKVTLYTAAGTFVAMMWLGGIGVLVSSFAGELDAIQALAEMTGAWAPVAMLTVVLSTLPVSAMNLYGGSLSLLTIRIPVNRVVGVVVIAAISLGVTLLMQGNPYGAFYDFLLILAYLVVPFSTILLLDYYLRMRPLGVAGVRQLFDPKRTFEWGFVAWIIGCAFSALFWNSTLFTGPLASTFSSVGDVAYLAGALGAAVAYLLLRRLPSLSRRRATATPSVDTVSA